MKYEKIEINYRGVAKGGATGAIAPPLGLYMTVFYRVFSSFSSDQHAEFPR